MPLAGGLGVRSSFCTKEESARLPSGPERRPRGHSDTRELAYDTGPGGVHNPPTAAVATPTSRAPDLAKAILLGSSRRPPILRDPLKPGDPRHHGAA